MTTELQPEWSPDEPYIRGSLDHTAGLLDGAQALLEKNLPHLAFHLGLLALEEIGKLEVVLMGRVGSEEEEAAFKKKFLDDHVGKLFWAFWGPSATHEMFNGKRVAWQQNFARSLHEKRLLGLYTDPTAENFVAPSEHVSPEDATMILDLARLRLEAQREYTPVELDEDEKADLLWFREARYDIHKRPFVLGQESMAKLQELKSTYEWIRWLRATYEAEQEEFRKLAEIEMARQAVEGDMERPKWKVRIRLKTSSHLIRPKAVKRWNEMKTPIHWLVVDKKPNQLLVEFHLPKHVTLERLNDVALSFSYRFITALNIGTRGFFWFDLPNQIEKFHELIEDVETKTYADVQRKAPPRFDRSVTNLSEADIQWTAAAFGLLPNDHPKILPFQRYLRGLMYWAKTDFHSGFEVNAYQAFFDAFQLAMQVNGDWDRKTPFVDAATAVLEPWIKNVREGVEEMVAIMDKMIPGDIAPEITIEQAAVVKLFADVYLMGVIDREAIRRRDAALQGEADDEGGVAPPDPAD